MAPESEIEFGEIDVDEIEMLEDDEDVEIVDSTSALFERSVKRTLRRWRYEAFEVDGSPAAVRLERTFEFNLEGHALADRDRNIRCAKVTGSRLCRSRTGYDDLGVVVVYNDP